MVSTPTSPAGSSKRYSASLLAIVRPDAQPRVGSQASTSSCLDGETVARWTRAMAGALQTWSGRAAGRLVADPESDQPPEVRQELVPLVRRVGLPHRVDQERVEVGGRDPLEDELVDVPQ